MTIAATEANVNLVLLNYEQDIAVRTIACRGEPRVRTVPVHEDEEGEHKVHPYKSSDTPRGRALDSPGAVGCASAHEESFRNRVTVSDQSM